MKSPTQAAPVRRTERKLTAPPHAAVSQSACCVKVLGQCLLEAPICP